MYDFYFHKLHHSRNKKMEYFTLDEFLLYDGIKISESEGGLGALYSLRHERFTSGARRKRRKEKTKKGKFDRE